MSETSDWRNTGLTIREGTWLYDGTVSSDVRIVRTNVRFGSGDHLDEHDVRDDQPGSWFDVQYSRAGDRGVYNGVHPGFTSESEASSWAEANLSGLTWLD